jgi:hypothetical protein
MSSVGSPATQRSTARFVVHVSCSHYIYSVSTAWVGAWQTTRPNQRTSKCGLTSRSCDEQIQSTLSTQPRDKLSFHVKHRWCCTAGASAQTSDVRNSSFLLHAGTQQASEWYVRDRGKEEKKKTKRGWDGETEREREVDGTCTVSYCHCDCCTVWMCRVSVSKHIVTRITHPSPNVRQPHDRQMQHAVAD